MEQDRIFCTLVEGANELKTSFERYFDALARQRGLTALQFFLLSEVDQGQVTSINDVSRVLGMSQGNASSLCKRMESAGLLCRQRNKSDERRVSLSLSQQGQEVLGWWFDLNERISLQMYADHPELMRQAMDGIAAASQLLSLAARQHSQLQTAILGPEEEHHVS